MAQSTKGLLQHLKQGNSKGRAIRFTGNRTLQNQLDEIAMAAGIIRAVFYRRTDGEDVSEQLKDEIRRLDKFDKEGIKSPDNKTRLQKVIEEVEAGFNIPGAQSTPYGRPLAQRPKVTVIEQEE